MLEDSIKDLQAIVNREQVDEELSDDPRGRPRL